MICLHSLPRFLPACELPFSFFCRHLWDVHAFRYPVTCQIIERCARCRYASQGRDADRGCFESDRNTTLLPLGIQVKWTGRTMIAAANRNHQRSLDEPGTAINAPDFCLASSCVQYDQLDRLPVCRSRGHCSPRSAASGRRAASRTHWRFSSSTGSG
jgi:hypothetical protein